MAMCFVSQPLKNERFWTFLKNGHFSQELLLLMIIITFNNKFVFVYDKSKLRHLFQIYEMQDFKWMRFRLRLVKFDF